VKYSIWGFEDKIDIKEKNRRILGQRTEELWKNTATSLKDQTCDSWAPKKEKMCNPKTQELYSTK
jgi:hypothetical protein